MKGKDGQHHARSEITIISDYSQNGAYDVEWFLNPSGSRNLEFEPQIAIQPDR